MEISGETLGEMRVHIFFACWNLLLKPNIWDFSIKIEVSFSTLLFTGSRFVWSSLFFCNGQKGKFFPTLFSYVAEYIYCCFFFTIFLVKSPPSNYKYPQVIMDIAHAGLQHCCNDEDEGVVNWFGISCITCSYIRIYILLELLYFSMNHKLPDIFRRELRIIMYVLLINFRTKRSTIMYINEM